MKAALFAYSRQGCRTAQAAAGCLPQAQPALYAPERLAQGDIRPIPQPSPPFYGRCFRENDALIFVGACGIAVRHIAPYVKDKRTDPAVLVIDGAGRYVIPLLSGHTGGANQLARQLARQLGATAAITTATDLNGRFSVDEWAAQQGFCLEDIQLAKAVSAQILEEDVPLCCEFPIIGALPAGLVHGRQGALGICISWRRSAPFARTLHLTPPVLHLGLGCRRGTPAHAIRRAVDRALEQAQIFPQAIGQVATIDLKADEPGLLDYCRQQGWRPVFYTAQQLQRSPGGSTPSPFVQQIAGVDNVCERAALMGAGRLVVKKTALDGVTVAVAAEHLEVCFG